MEPPMTMQINPMTRAEKLKNAMIVDIAVVNSKVPGKKRDFFVILLLVRKTNKERKRMASVKQSWEIEKNVRIS